MVVQAIEQIERGAFVMSEMADDYETRLRAGKFIGHVLAGRELSLVEAQQEPEITSLYDALQLVHETDDKQARAMITTNAHTDVVERTIKAGFVMEVELSVDAKGQIQQFGQNLKTIQKNSLTHMRRNAAPQMLARTEAETRNAWRLQAAYEQGLLNDYAMVVISRAPDDMSSEAAAKAGFFTDTMSCALQVTSMQNGTLVTESAFVAGTAKPGGSRHDKQGVMAISEYLNVDINDKSSTELLDAPLLVHQSLMPNGAVDLMQIYETGVGVGRIDYTAFRQQCRDREELLAGKVTSIVDELISEAPRISSPTEATRRLAKISEKHMIQQAVFDPEINPMVFGAAAAEHIEAAQEYIARGFYEEALHEVRSAELVAVSSSCPDGGSGPALGVNGAETAQKGDAQDTPGDCVYISKSCPKCGEKNVKTTVSKGTIKGSCGCKAKLS